MSANSLCAWRVEDGMCWIQTREAHFARKLTKRRDTRLVGAAVAGGFLRIFEIKRPPAFVRLLIGRYVTANARFGKLEGRYGTQNCRAG
jgi:hypothetical protein